MAAYVKKYNNSVYSYNEDEVQEMIVLFFVCFLMIFLLHQVKFLRLYVKYI